MRGPSITIISINSLGIIKKYFGSFRELFWKISKKFPEIFLEISRNINEIFENYLNFIFISENFEDYCGEF